MNNALLSRALETENIPSLPHVAIEVLALSRRASATADDLAAIVQNDPAIAARLLKIVNSALYGIPRKIGSVRQAISMLGIRSVTVTVLTFALVEGIKAQPAEGMSLEGYWRRSLSSAVIARTLAKDLSKGLAEEAFVAGLLSDIGVLVAWRSEPELYGAILQRAECEKVALHELEMQAFGVDHALISAELLRKWRLPDQLSDAVEGHHGRAVKAAQGDAGLLIKLALHAASLSSLICGEACASLLETTKAACVSDLGIDPDDLEAILVGLNFAVQEAANALSVEIGAPVDYAQLKADAAMRLAGLSIEADAERAQLVAREEAARSDVDRLRQENRAILEVASTDKLTKLSNRAALDKAIGQALIQTRTSNEAFAIFFMDVDFFKGFNDTHGHSVGDEALRVVAGALRETLGAHGVVGRYGGEEFVSVLTGKREHECRRLAEETRAAVERQRVSIEGKSLSVTISVGVAFADQWPQSTSGDQILKLADEQLYKAKRAGRNRVEMAVFAQADSSRPIDLPAAA